MFDVKLLRIGIAAVLGAIGATVIAWGGLYLFGTMRGPGSLFDTDPDSANRFLLVGSP